MSELFDALTAYLRADMRLFVAEVRLYRAAARHWLARRRVRRAEARLTALGLDAEAIRALEKDNT